MFWFLQVRRPEDNTCDTIVPLGSTLPNFKQFADKCAKQKVDLGDGFESSYFNPMLHAVKRSLEQPDPSGDNWHYCAWMLGSTFMSINGLAQSFTQ